MRNLILKRKGLVLAGVAGLTLATGGLALSTTPAEAGARTGTWKYYNPGYRGGYAYRGGYGYRPHYGYRRGYGGGAVAAGLATGLALGALGAAAAAPSYGYAPVYGGYAPACYWTRQAGYDYWGNYVVRRVQVCD
jgi:hypothetical protein